MGSKEKEGSCSGAAVSKQSKGMAKSKRLGGSSLVPFFSPQSLSSVQTDPLSPSPPCRRRALPAGHPQHAPHGPPTPAHGGSSAAAAAEAGALWWRAAAAARAAPLPVQLLLVLDQLPDQPEQPRARAHGRAALRVPPLQPHLQPQRAPQEAPLPRAGGRRCRRPGLRRHVRSSGCASSLSLHCLPLWSGLLCSEGEGAAFFLCTRTRSFRCVVDWLERAAVSALVVFPKGAAKTKCKFGGLEERFVPIAVAPTLSQTSKK